MRFLKFLLLALLAGFVVLLAIANRGVLELRIWPRELPVPELFAAWPPAYVMPVYVALLGAVFLGMVIGVMLELVRESRHRRQERRYRKEAERLFDENRRLRARLGWDEDDDVLGLAEI